MLPLADVTPAGRCAVVTRSVPLGSDFAAARPCYNVSLTRRHLRLAPGFGVSAVLVALLLRAVDLHDLAAAVATADFRLVLPSIALYFAGLWVRSLRWGLLLPRGSASTGTLFRTLVVGFTVNNLLPARLGEVARAYLLSRWCGVAYGTTLASVVVERILDGLALAALLLAALLVVPDAPPYLLALGLTVGGAFAAGAILLLLAAWRSESIAILGRRVGRGLPPRVATLSERLATSFAQGLKLVRGWRLLARLAVLSLLAWACELALFYVLMLGFSLPASVPLAVLGGTAANFATLVPSSPGYVGTFDAVLVKVLVDVSAGSVTPEQATAYALVVHATLLVPVVLLGALILWRSNVSLKQITRASTQPVPAAVARGVDG